MKQPGRPSAASSRSWTRLDGVDLLRGLAIFFVLMNHVNMRLLFAHVAYTKGLPSQIVSSLVWNGQYGVQIFSRVQVNAESMRSFLQIHVEITPFALL